MPLHLEVKHLGGETVAIDLDHSRMAILQLDQLGQRQRAVALASDPDLFLALQHAQQSGLTCHHFGIHTCTSSRYRETKQQIPPKPVAKPHDDAFITYSEQPLDRDHNLQG